MKRFAVAVDGPAGSGKSTLAKKIAERLGLLYVDTGAMYRAVAYYCMKNGIPTGDEDAVNAALKDIHMDVRQEDGVQAIYINGEAVNDKIRTPEAGKGASDVAVFLRVREKLVEVQRGLAENTGVIMDGRDIGTNVLKTAEVKIYLTASVEERTRRRMADFEAMGERCDFDAVREQIMARDKNDTEREHNPLRKAADAIEVDTTGKEIDENVEEIIEIIKRITGAANDKGNSTKS